MGTIIEAAVSLTDPEKGAIDLATAAGLRAIEAADVDASTVDILIFVGVYRDQNVVEPSIVHRVQNRMGLNLDPDFGRTRGQTLSFDISNGECGFLNAVQVVSSMLENGADAAPSKSLDGVRRALIVTGDAPPSNRPSEDFPFPSAGAAAMLAWDDRADRGFQSFAFRTSPAGPGVAGGLYVNRGANGRNLVSIEVDRAFGADALAFGSEVATDYLRSIGVSPASLDFVVTSQHGDELGAQLAAAIGADQAVEPASKFAPPADTHTAAQPFAFGRLLDEGLVEDGSRILFLSVGSGLSCACALYVA